LARAEAVTVAARFYGSKPVDPRLAMAGPQSESLVRCKETFRVSRLGGCVAKEKKRVRRRPGSRKRSQGCCDCWCLGRRVRDWSDIERRFLVSPIGGCHVKEPNTVRRWNSQASLNGRALGSQGEPSVRFRVIRFRGCVVKEQNTVADWF